ncbi:MAG: DUF4115 domain-containing protein [Woeseiaceae bacterium]|nr:DUF4115 domain-containing protein [Woeseiaceae bacterium]
MSEDVDNQETDESADEPRGPIGGERLAEARREQQISVLEIAKELHLDEPKVRALERNEFEVLGAPVFAKGHLRKYAELVNVDPDDALADYYQLERAGEMPPLVSTRRQPRKELSPGPWIAIIVVLIVVATAYWWLTSRPLQTETAAPEPDVGEEADPGAVVPPETDGGSVDAPKESDPDTITIPAEAGEETVEASLPAQAPVEETSSPAIADGQMRILLTYTGDCWTEITDASGRRLFFNLGKDGRTVELTGAEPFNVLFGNPGNVTVRVNGEDYALPATSRPDRPLRLTVSGT